MTDPVLRRQSSLDVAVEALHKLVEGRYNPDCRDRSGQFFEDAGQWTVWLTRDEHERYKAALADVEKWLSEIDG